MDSEKTLDQLYKELERAESERDLKGRKHPDYGPANCLVKSIRNTIENRLKNSSEK